MKYNKDFHHRHSLRLQGYDYSKAGFYFVTICVKDRDCLLGEIVRDRIYLSLIGDIVKEFWLNIPAYHHNTQLDEFVIMPNHIHGIIIIGKGGYFMPDGIEQDVKFNVPTSESKTEQGIDIVPPEISDYYSHLSPGKGTLPVIIRSYKAAVTHHCQKSGHSHFRWQRNYYERIIRDKSELNRIRNYIRLNPQNWMSDEENPLNIINSSNDSQMHRRGV